MPVHTSCPLPSPWSTYIARNPTHALYYGIHSFSSISSSSPFLLLKMSNYLRAHIVALATTLTFVSAQSTFPAMPLASKTFVHPTGIVTPSYALGIVSDSVGCISPDLSGGFKRATISVTPPLKTSTASVHFQHSRRFVFHDFLFFFLPRMNLSCV